MRRIACDTGPLLHLGEADLLSLLPLAGEISIPPTVKVELLHHIPAGQLPDWITVVDLAPGSAVDALRWQRAGLLDPGEAEAIALARQQSAQWLLTDDAAARWIAQSLGQEVHGSLGIVLWAAVAGHLDQAQAGDALERLSATSLWISTRVLAEARRALRQIFA